MMGAGHVIAIDEVPERLAWGSRCRQRPSISPKADVYEN